MKLLKSDLLKISQYAPNIQSVGAPIITMSQKTEKLTFEEALDRLQVIIESMEDGNIDLAKLVTKFEEGSTLLKKCQKELQHAELKIEKLNLETGNLDPFKNRESDD